MLTSNRVLSCIIFVYLYYGPFLYMSLCQHVIFPGRKGVMLVMVTSPASPAKLLQLEPLVLCQWRLAGLEHGLLKLAYKVPLTLAASNKGASFYQMTWLIA